MVVREGQLGPTVSAAFLRLDGPEERTGVTNAEGIYRFQRLPAGTYTVHAEHLAYGAVEVEVEVAGDDGTTRIVVEMRREPIALEGLEVEVDGRRPTWGPLEQVYDRVEWQQRLGLGIFITREDIENRVAMRVRHLVQGRMMGRSIGRSRSFSCSGPVWYLDGHRLRSGDVDAFVSPGAVELIEIYRGAAQVPGVFAHHNPHCGVVAVWTRRGF